MRTLRCMVDTDAMLPEAYSSGSIMTPKGSYYWDAITLDRVYGLIDWLNDQPNDFALVADDSRACARRLGGIGDDVASVKAGLELLMGSAIGVGEL